jgi:serine/threonine protein kinase
MCEKPENSDSTNPPGSSVEAPTETFPAAKAASDPLTVVPATPSVGTIASGAIAGYELLGTIGSGGMGVVYRAREPHSGRLIALKMMLGEQAAGTTDLQRFLLEARAAGQINHPGIVAVHSWGEHGGHPFYTMDFVPGPPMSRLLEKGPLDVSRAVKYLLGIGRAVAAAHAHGIVHRDLKPGNIIIDASDQPRILDFGLAKRHGPEAGLPAPGDGIMEAVPIDVPKTASATPRVTPNPITEKGAILGTPSYMAPEQVRGQTGAVSPASDVHALGAIFFEMLTGRPPYAGDNNYVILKQVLNSGPPSVRALTPKVPRTLDELCRRCLAKEPADRYADAGNLADDLERRWNSTRQRIRFSRLTLTAASVVLVLGVVQVLLANNASWDVVRWSEDLAAQATANGPLREAAGMLAGLAQAILLTLTPLAAGLSGFAWLTAWLWHSERPVRLGLVWLAGAILSLALWLAADFPLTHLSQSAFAWLAAATPFVLLGAALYRLQIKPKGVPKISTARTDPYLQKLLGTRTNLQARPLNPGAERMSGLADFEAGRELHVWSGGRVFWARQPSLDRTVLIWVHTGDGPGAGAGTGVVVRHRFVLNLHLVGMGTEGRFLVTEGTAATPLANFLLRGPLPPLDAVKLTIRLAAALQAFHDQGAHHGRFGPDWILVRGEFEPVLCPCGLPGVLPDQQARDVQALGRLFSEWLPPRPRFWQMRPEAALYRVGHSAAAGTYSKASDLAHDLESSLQSARLRRRVRLVNYLALAFIFLPLVPLLGLSLAGSPPAADSGAVAFGVLTAIGSGALIVGFNIARFWIQRRRLRLSAVVRGTIGFGGTVGSLLPVALIGVLAITYGAYLVPEAQGPGGKVKAVLVVLLVAAGYGVLGAIGAALATGVDVLMQSLRGDRAAAESSPDSMAT